MNIALLNIMHTKEWDFRPDMAQGYANALRNAIEMHVPNDIKKKHGYFLSKKGVEKDGQVIGAAFQDKLYVGDIHRIERHLYWNDEELQEDDQIVNVVVVDGPVTRDGDGCSYGTKDFRDQVMYANTIPQVVGHIFLINTPGGMASCRNDYEMMIADCRQAGKPTVAFVDGMCCSSGVNLASRCDRTVVMNPRDEFGCIGTMAAFWAVAHDTVDQDGYRYVELVGKDCPEKNDWYREAAAGEYEKLQADLDKDTEEFHDTVRQGRPLVTDDMLKGKVFEAQEVIPALVDEIGDMERAIECVFELAEERLTAARLVTAEPKQEPAAEPAQEPEELARLNEQQKAALASEAAKGNLVMAEDGHVTKVVDTIFGPATVEVAQPQNENNMPNEEELKAQEAAAAQAAEQEPAQEPAAEPAAEPAQEPAQEPAAGEGAQEPAAEPAQEPAAEPSGDGAQEPAQEPGGEPAAEPSGEGAQEPAQEPAAEPAAEPSGEGAQEPAGEPAAEPAAEPASQEAARAAEEELDRIQETLRGAEQMIADKDAAIAERNKTIAEMKDEIERLHVDGTKAGDSIKEKDAEIESLKKQVADLQAEVKELSGKPAPMTDEKSGIPAGNAAGEQPVRQKRVRRDMSYEEVRQAMGKKA